MKSIKITLLALFIGLFSFVNAQENSLLWKISENGLEEPSYIYGTIHLICKDQIQLSDKVQQALKNCQQLTLELDMDEADFMSRMQQQSLNPNMENISDKLSEEDRSLLNVFFKKHYGADLSQLGILKPFVLTSMMYAKAVDCDTAGSIEAALMEYAQPKGWEVNGLESIEDQFAIFDNVEVEEQLSWLVKYAKDEETFKGLMKKITQSYLSEDVESIAKITDDFPEYADIEDAMLADRNSKWIQSIVEQAKSKPTFFAVGAAHLGTDSGVIELLREEGYKVEAVL